MKIKESILLLLFFIIGLHAFSQNYIPRSIFNTYNSFSNSTYITKVRSFIVGGIWDKYPIAKIKNVEYSQITGLICESALKTKSEKTEPSNTDIQTINNLPTNTNLSDALITTYTYKPLVGILTVTDPYGVTSMNIILLVA